MVQTIEGDGGPDLLEGDQDPTGPRPLNDKIRGRGGQDTLSGGGGVNTLSGGAGIDTAEYEYTSPELGPPQQGIVLGLGGGFWPNAFGGLDVLYDVENANGTDAFGDRIFGSDAANRIDGRGGDDILLGREGDDTLVGGDGLDGLEGDAGRDRLFGGPGPDGLDGGPGADVAAGGGGDDAFLFYVYDAENDLVPDPSGHDLVRGFAGAGGPSGAAGEQDQIIIVMGGLGSLLEVADGGTRKIYLVREDGEDRGYLTVESVNGEDLVVGSDAVPGVDVVFIST